MSDPRPPGLTPEEMMRRMQTDWHEVAKYAVIIVVGCVMLGLLFRLGLALLAK
jgi:hypothetical protein